MTRSPLVIDHPNPHAGAQYKYCMMQFYYDTFSMIVCVQPDSTKRDAQRPVPHLCHSQVHTHDSPGPLRLARRTNLIEHQMISRSALAMRCLNTVKAVSRPKCKGSLRTMSTESSDGSTNAKVAIVGLAGACFAFGYKAMIDKRDNKQDNLEAIEVGSEEEMHLVRQERFNQGIKEAVAGAGIWGGTSVVALYGLRPAEPHVFGTRILQNAGTPRLWWIITAMTLAGFAIHGEKTLTMHGRQVVRIVEDKDKARQ